MTLKCRHNSKKLQLFIVMSLPNARGNNILLNKGTAVPFESNFGDFCIKIPIQLRITVETKLPALFLVKAELGV